ncbi:MAG: helix-turn-helix domain-containing protein [Devosia sp.]
MGHSRVPEEVKNRHQDTAGRDRSHSRTSQAAAERIAVEEDDFELVHGSGNIFRDFGDPNPDVEQARALLAVEIIKVLDRRKLTVRGAEEATGIAASEFSRIRNLKLSRFTLDRLIAIFYKLNPEVEVTLKFARWKPAMAEGKLHPPVGDAA